LELIDFVEKNFFITFGVVIGVGVLHGAVLGRGIRNRFPSFKRHARFVSIFLLCLFTINAFVNVIKFAEPNKVSVSDLFIPTTSEEFVSILFNLLGINAGLVTIIGTFISISLILFLKFAHIHKVARYFIFTLSVIVLAFAFLARFTDFVPTSFQIISFAFYQSGITAGIFFVTRKKISDVSEIT